MRSCYSARDRKDAYMDTTNLVLMALNGCGHLLHGEVQKSMSAYNKVFCLSGQTGIKFQHHLMQLLLAATVMLNISHLQAAGEMVLHDLFITA